MALKWSSVDKGFLPAFAAPGMAFLPPTRIDEQSESSSDVAKIGIISETSK